MKLTKPDQKMLNMAQGIRSGSTLTISNGIIAPIEQNHGLETESGALSDDLETLTVDAMADGALLMLHSANPLHEIVVKHGTGNIRTTNRADLILDTIGKTILLRRAGAVWEVISPMPENRILAKELATIGPLTALIPGDNTIPQNTEGTEIISANITPRYANSILRISCEIPVVFAQTFCAVCLAIFRDSAPDAVAVGLQFIPNGGNFSQILVSHEMLAGSDDETTFSVRVGPTNAENIYINGISPILGGAAALTLRVEEITR